MLDFIIENILLFVVVGGVIILIAIGYIVDKFVINKDSTKVTKTDGNESETPKNNSFAENAPQVESVNNSAENVIEADSLKKEEIQNIQAAETAENLESNLNISNVDNDNVVGEPQIETISNNVENVIEDDSLKKEEIQNVQAAETAENLESNLNISNVDNDNVVGEPQIETISNNFENVIEADPLKKEEIQNVQETEVIDGLQNNVNISSVEENVNNNNGEENVVVTEPLFSNENGNDSNKTPWEV